MFRCRTRIHRRSVLPTIRDRTVQAAAKLVLEPILEADLDPSAYGYRPKRGGLDAIKEVHALICRGYTDVVDADLSKYLDVSSHYTFRFFERVEKVRSNHRYLYSQAFCPSAVDMNGLELAALYTVQDGLPRDTE